MDFGDIYWTKWTLNNSDFCCNSNFIDHLLSKSNFSTSNESKEGFPAEDFNQKVNVDEFHHLSLRIVGGILCGLIVLLTLVGNVMLVVSVVVFRRLRSVTNMLMASLAVADITVAAFVMPYLLVYDLLRSWEFGPIFCHIWISCDVMCCTASILHLCIIAFDRFMAITNPLRYKVLMSRRRGIFLVVCAWFCSAAISFVPIMFGWYSDSSVSLQLDTGECGLNVNPIYAVVSSLTSFYLPSPIMFYIYTKILVIARRQSKEIERMKRTIHQSSKLEQRRFKRHSKKVISDTKAIKTLGLIMGAFCTCWLPFFLMYLVLPFCPNCDLSYETRSAITWLGYINSFINPCIYGFLNGEFRAAFLKTMRCDFSSDSGYRSRSESGSSILNRSLHSVSSLELDSVSSGKSKSTTNTV